MLNITKAKQLRELISDLSSDDLRDAYEIVLAQLKAVRTIDALLIKNTLHVGMRVVFGSPKKGYHEGTITKINRTKAVVSESITYMNWTVPMTMLKEVK